MAQATSPAQQRQLHVVAVPLPAQGHATPLLRFCNLLASELGVLVTFVNVDPLYHTAQEQPPRDDEADSDDQQPPLSNPSAGPSQELPCAKVRRARIPLEGLHLAAGFRGSARLFFEAQDSIAPHLELLIHKLNGSGSSVTCIISDVCMTRPTQNVADKLNIPRIVFIPHGASFLLLYHHIIHGETICKTKVLEALTRRAERREIFSDRLTGLPTIYNHELPWYQHVHVDDNEFMWEFTTEVYGESFGCASAVVINSCEGLEAPAFMDLSKHLPLLVYGVGPLVEPLPKESFPCLWTEEEACILWLDQQPPLSVLYISFGSLSLISGAQIVEIVAGILSSGQRFLWAFRPDLAEHSRTCISDILSECDGRGYVVSWAPQLGALSHPSVGGFLTHCGWNSTMEAIVHGVPMLCWPYFADQLLNVKYVVEEWKVGLQFEASRKAEGADERLVERGEVDRLIKAVMEGEEGRALRKKAMELKEVGYGSLLPGGTSHNNIQALVRSLL